MTRPHPRSSPTPNTTLVQPMAPASANTFDPYNLRTTLVLTDRINWSWSLGSAVGAVYFAWKIDDGIDRKSRRLNSSHANITYAVFCLKKNEKNPSSL